MTFKGVEGIEDGPYVIIDYPGGNDGPLAKSEFYGRFKDMDGAISFISASIVAPAQEAGVTLFDE